MTTRIIPLDVFDLVVFGATGDLAQRKLLPALFHRDDQGQLPEGARIIGASRREMSREAFKAMAVAAIEAHVPEAERSAETCQRFYGRLGYVTVDAAQEAGWSDLEKALKSKQDRIRVFYLAVGPDLFGPICDRLGKHGLATPRSRVVIEKPLGKSGASARAVNESIGRVFAEPSAYRIDHYLGKETVQNLMALRFANALFEPLWNSAHIDHMQITVAETLGLGGRAGYDDTAGALCDMVQNHMLQLLCLVAMEPPTSIAADAVRDEKLKVLRSLKPTAGEAVANLTARGQFRAGAANGGAVPAAIHVTPEAASGGPIARIRDGDTIRVDADRGRLEVLVSEKELAARSPAQADLVPNWAGTGRELFSAFRAIAGRADQGASILEEA
jgi:glucose-6-phosphate 1-dehydrogenase